MSVRYDDDKLISPSSFREGYKDAHTDVFKRPVREIQFNLHFLHFLSSVLCLKAVITDRGGSVVDHVWALQLFACRSVHLEFSRVDGY